MQNAPFVLGLDIGYGNLKVAFGHTNQAEMTTVLRPVGAASIDSLGIDMGGSRPDGVEVLVDGEPWIAGVDPYSLGSAFQRTLHADYPSTRQYLALFHAALVMTKRKVIDVLVIGLPVVSFKDKGEVMSLKSKLAGSHTVSKGRIVEVREVAVVPQPMGAYLDYLYCTGANTDDQSVLVFDPGQFSVDWVLVQAKQIQKDSSDSSKLAMSVVLEKAAALVKEQYQFKVTPEKIERAVRGGQKQLVAGKNRIDVAELMSAAGKDVSKTVIDQVMSNMRKSDETVDTVVIAGGGAQSFSEAVHAHFPQSEVHLAERPVFSNVRGFWQYGWQVAQKMGRAAS